MEASEKASVASGRHQEELYLRFVTCCVTKKENQSCGPKIILPPCPKKFSNFSRLRLFQFVGPAHQLWSLAFM